MGGGFGNSNNPNSTRPPSPPLFFLLTRSTHQKISSLRLNQPPRSSLKEVKNGLKMVFEERFSASRVQAAESAQQRRCRHSAQRRNAGAHGSGRARVPASECDKVRGPFAEGAFFNGALVPEIQLAILEIYSLFSGLAWRGQGTWWTLGCGAVMTAIAGFSLRKL